MPALQGEESAEHEEDQQACNLEGQPSFHDVQTYVSKGLVVGHANDGAATSLEKEGDEVTVPSELGVNNEDSGIRRNR